jgi:hypothetical protein
MWVRVRVRVRVRVSRNDKVARFFDANLGFEELVTDNSETRYLWSNLILILTLIYYTTIIHSSSLIMLLLPILYYHSINTNPNPSPNPNTNTNLNSNTNLRYDTSGLFLTQVQAPKVLLRKVIAEQ